MGFLDRMLKNVAEDIIVGTVRNVEYTASRKISDKMIDAVEDMADNVKGKAHGKISEAKQAIDETSQNYMDNPQIVKNADTGDVLNFASRKKLKYHYINHDKGIDTSLGLNFFGAITFSSEVSYIGNSSVAHRLSNAAYQGIQNALDEIANTYAEPSRLPSMSYDIIQSASELIRPLCQEYGLKNCNLVILKIGLDDDELNRYNSLSYNTHTATASAAQTWHCEFCGLTSSGDICEHCSAPRQL